MEELKNEKASYKLFWTGEEISIDFLAQYYANELDDIKAKNNLLGSFDEQGEYSFNAETKKGLIALKKKIEEKREKSYFVIAKTPKNTFSFKLKIFEVEDSSLLAANLYLVEVVDDERITKPLKTFVAQYVDKNNEEFLNKVKYIFNISIDDVFLENEKLGNEEIITPLLPQIEEINEFDLEQIDEKFVTEILKILEEKGGEKEKKILKKFYEETSYNEKKKEQEPIKYSEIKKRLSAIIEKEKGFQTIILEIPEVGNVIKEYNEAKKEAIKKASMIEVASSAPPVIEKAGENNKDEKGGKSKASSGGGGKKASGGGGGKSGGGKSGGGKKSGGGGGGSKPKKKDAKKADPPYKGAIAPIIEKIKDTQLKKKAPETKKEPVLKNRKVVPKIADKQIEKVKKQPRKEIPEKEKSTGNLTSLLDSLEFGRFESIVHGSQTQNEEKIDEIDNNPKTEIAEHAIEEIVAKVEIVEVENKEILAGAKIIENTPEIIVEEGYSFFTDMPDVKIEKRENDRVF